MLRTRVRVVRKFKPYSPPARPLLSPFNRALGVSFVGVMAAYLLTLSGLHGIALVAMLGALLGLVAAAVAPR
ncbi:hypothetical protein BH24DEI1_BH24DEI1_15550 [soil metagenome]